MYINYLICIKNDKNYAYKKDRYRKQIGKILPDISISTIEKVLNDVIEENKIYRIGS